MFRPVFLNIFTPRPISAH